MRSAGFRKKPKGDKLYEACRYRPASLDQDIPLLVKYLRDDLGWPINSENFEDLTFDYAAEELGLDAATAVKVKEIKQLRPITHQQPWGIFFINFEPKRLPIVVLRRILRALVIKKRASATKASRSFAGSPVSTATSHINFLVFVPIDHPLIIILLL